MQLLLDHKAEVGLADAKGWTPLHLAARVGAAAKVECLLAAGAKASDVNSQGNTPLHLVSCLCVGWRWRCGCGCCPPLRPQVSQAMCWNSTCAVKR
jgi:hypothetical protein